MCSLWSKLGTLNPFEQKGTISPRLAPGVLHWKMCTKLMAHAAEQYKQKEDNGMSSMCTVHKYEQKKDNMRSTIECVCTVVHVCGVNRGHL